MHSSIIVTKPAPDISLITLYEAKIALNIPTSDTSSDEALKFFILRSSDEAQVLCSRFFARESVIETFREVVNPITRLYLSRYPVKPEDIVSIEVDGAPLTGYDIDPETGKLSLWDGTTWAESIVATYTGGYEVPQGVPPSLRQAVILLTREAYYSTAHGDSSVRSITHKESRIMYFDPAAMVKAMSSGGGSGPSGGTAAQKAAQSLLQRYTRLTA
jgi:hypothetical protein